MSTSQPLIPAAFHGLVDDAAVFPPGNAPLNRAVRDHLGHREAAYADLVGPLVVGDAMLPDLQRLVEPVETTLGVSVVVSGGAGAIEPAVRWATGSERLDLRGIEIALRDSATGELAHNARRLVTAVDQLVSMGDLDDEVPVYVEMPRLYGSPPTPDWFGALDEIAAMDHRLKFRTGGLDADAFPSPHELAAGIGAALDRELAFKCTAGLHNAVRHHDAVTGFDHHGFLNVLLATRASLDGASVDDVAAVLVTRDGRTLTDGTDEAGLTGARHWFRSFGSCSVLEPLADLRTLDLVTEREM